MANPTVIIQISWTASGSAGVTGYNVYLVTGAPENTTKTLLAFVSGPSTTTYNYSGTEGTQYQFEVRATDGTYESPPLEIFYPNGTGLWTPTLITPTGHPMMVPRNTPYLTKEEFLNYANGLKLTVSSALYTSGLLDVYLSSASEMVDNYTQRHFSVQTIDEVYDGVRIGRNAPRMMTVQLNERPVQCVNSVYIQVLKFFINFDLSYLQMFPDKGFYQMVPFLGGATTGAVPLPAEVLNEGLIAKIWTNYTFGYDVIPNAIKVATSMIATKLIALQENPVGAQSVQFGRTFKLEWRKDDDPLWNMVEMLLRPYKSPVYRRP